MTPIEKYTRLFKNLKIDRSKGAAAPHKPILLLTVLSAYEDGSISQNRIFITPLLVASFKDLWTKLKISSQFVPNFSLPFFHLKSSGFWCLKSYPGRTLTLTSSKSIKSFSQLKSVVHYVQLNDDLHELLMNPIYRSFLRSILMHTYFSKIDLLADDKKTQEVKNERPKEIEGGISTQQYLQKLESQILFESPNEYRQMALNFDEEEIYVRSYVFKKSVPTVYNQTCSISGLRIISGQGSQMIDACHIVPFALSHDDTISNGISLCPNLHRAFDRGLLGIDDNYKVILKSFEENENNYSIRQFDQVKITLPENPKFYPSLENFAWHRQAFGF